MKRDIPKVTKRILTKKKPEKRLLKFLNKKAGRNFSGRITVRHQGGGVKKLYRIIDFGQEKIDIPGKVISLEYDPYRTAFIALVEYRDGDRRYVLVPQGLEVGSQLIAAETAEILPGNRMKIKNIPVGTMVYNIEIEPGCGGKMVRGAGTGAKILAHEGKYTHIKMPSKEIRKVLQECFASVGMVSHQEHIFENIGKVGRSRLMGRRPEVRGSAMNPPDHPHGGGEGKTPIGLRFPKTPWGKPARGVRTRKRGWTDKFILKRRK